MQKSDGKRRIKEIPVLTLHAAQDLTPYFRPLLEQGFEVRIKADQTVQDILCRQLGVAEAYLRDRVQTVFLNGKAVDDETTAVVPPSARLALSASMPGLVGATMRKGGFFSGLRSAISHQSDGRAADQAPDAVITIKLFNMIATEIGSLFLERGIGVKGDQLAPLLAGLSEDFWMQIESAGLDGQPMDVKQIKAEDWTAAPVCLQVVTA